MIRGDIWTAGGAGIYAGKPRPVVIIQNSRIEATASVTICGFTTEPIEASAFRPDVEPSEENGLQLPCRLMTDKIMTMPRSSLGKRVGRLAGEDMRRLDRAILLFLGLAP